MSQHLRRLAWAAQAIFLASACAGANMTAYTPVKEKTKFNADVLYRAAREAVEKSGTSKLQNADGVAHTVDTREREVAISSIPRLGYKYSFHIETTDGVLSIEAKCVQNSASKESEYKDCGDDRPKLVIDEQAELAKKTLELAPKQENTSVDWSTFGKEPPPEPEKTDAPKTDAKKGEAKKPKASGSAKPAASAQ